jgi:hypothetical protein
MAISKSRFLRFARDDNLSRKMTNRELYGTAQELAEGAMSGVEAVFFPKMVQDSTFE